MATPVLVMGKSGSGKTASLRNTNGKWFLVNVNKKPLPFKKTEDLIVMNCDDVITIRQKLKSCYPTCKSVVIDDAGYLLTKKFMEGHREKKGNSGFELYNDIADTLYNLIVFISNELPQDQVVYVVMHEDKNDFGESKPKTIGRLLDEKVCVEGMFTIVLHALKRDGKYVFATRTDGLDVTKSPIGMFEDEYIENDLQAVDNAIRKYYDFDKESEENK